MSGIAPFPDGSWESIHLGSGNGRGHPGIVLGLDEAGRGALAGPVAAACVFFDPPAGRFAMAGINDSKLLSPGKRERLFSWILENAGGVSVGWASVEEIERLNIRMATLLAMRRAVDGLLTSAWSAHTDLLAIDGQDVLPDLPIPQVAVVGGDRQVLTIAAASIVAKVSRDRLMGTLDTVHPEYHFRDHKGYGTLVHRQSIRTYGLSPHHRALFCRKALGR